MVTGHAWARHRTITDPPLSHLREQSTVSSGSHTPPPAADSAATDAAATDAAATDAAATDAADATNDVIVRPMVPRRTPETAFFWDGCDAGQLLLQHCRSCDRPWYPAQRNCPRCQGNDIDIVAASGRGRLASYVVNHRDAPGFAAPYVIALVELDEGPRMLTNLVDCAPDPDTLPVGTAVQVRFQPVATADGRATATLAVFTPDNTPDNSAKHALDNTADHTATRAAPDPAPPTGASRFSGPDLPDPVAVPAVRFQRRGVAIVGAAETTELGTIDHLTPVELHLDAARNALADAGLAAADIDGVACAGVSPIEISFGLGITPTWVDGTMVGGSSFMLHVRHAVAALEAGMATCVLITHGESGRSRVGGMPVGRRSPLIEQFEWPFGVAGPPTMFTLPALAWMDRYNITEDQLAAVAVAQRRWAAMNPRAAKRDLITVDDVLDSPMVAWPFRKLMCCLVTDGGGALVLTTAERSTDTAGQPVHVLGTGEAVETPLVSQMADLTSSRAFRLAGRRALAEAGITTADVDHLMAYDAFAHTPCYALEALGFTEPGQAPAFIAEGHTSPGGALPMNTNGGGLSYTHTGMYGMFALQESVRQVRGTAAAQVDDVHISVAHGVGGMFAASGTIVLGDEPASR
jgi:acetyl-CoA acetyltransferase/uncharacterized OB-fold protein